MPRHCHAILLRTACVALIFASIATLLFDGTRAASTVNSLLAYSISAGLDKTPAFDVSADPAGTLAFAWSAFYAAPNADPLSPTDADEPLVASASGAAGEVSKTTALTATTAVSTAVTSPVSVTNATASRLELAHARVAAEGLKTELIIVSPSSTGVALAIYRDLRLRRYRSTTGPDEGIDTHSLACYPACVFVPIQEVNALPVDRWVAVLRHEYRHVIQATHNPTMAADFRSGPTGLFTSYGLFSEVCADYGIAVAPSYRAAARMATLKRTLGAGRQTLIDQACQGNKPAYDSMVLLYNQLRHSSGAFATLFPRYR